MKIYRYGPSNQDSKIETDKKTPEELREKITSGTSSLIDVDLTVNKLGQKQTRAEIQIDDEDIESMFLAYHNKLKTSLKLAQLKIATLEIVLESVGNELEIICDECAENSILEKEELDEDEDFLDKLECIKDLTFHWKKVFVDETHSRTKYIYKSKWFSELKDYVKERIQEEKDSLFIP